MVQYQQLPSKYYDQQPPAVKVDGSWSFSVAKSARL